MTNQKILSARLPGVRQNVVLAGYTTFKIGGPARFFYEAKTIPQLTQAVSLARQLAVPFFVLGGGSNLLVSDRGFPGLVIKFSAQKCRINSFFRSVYAEAGLSLGDLVSQTARVGLSGLEFLAGIPGTLGGAINGNAGAWQQSIGNLVKKVFIYNAASRQLWLSPDQCQFAYRQSRFKNGSEIILAAKFSLPRAPREKINRQIKEILVKRQSLPKEPSAGCIFINPKPNSAGKIIDSLGLKGLKKGGAKISSAHANFIINCRHASSRDILELIEIVKTKVFTETGLSLSEEIVKKGFSEKKLANDSQKKLK